MSRLFGTTNGKQFLSEAGKQEKDLGNHSIRKGASTYVSSGSTACPSASAIRIRGGWKQGGCMDRYIRYDDAGDQHVGRTITGLPVNNVDFAIY